MEVDGEVVAVAEGPGEFGVELEIEVGVFRGEDFRGFEAVEAHEPIGLIEAVFAEERWWLEGEDFGGLGDGAEGGVVDAAEFVVSVEVVGAGEEIGVGGLVGADDDLGALAGGVAEFFVAVFPAVVGFIEFVADVAHGGLGAGEVLFWG